MKRQERWKILKGSFYVEERCQSIDEKKSQSKKKSAVRLMIVQLSSRERALKIIQK